MTDFKVSNVASLVIDAEATELAKHKSAVMDAFDVEPHVAMVVAIVTEDCLHLLEDPLAFQVRVAAWRQLAREYADVREPQ